MDLSWCIICDNRIDSEMCESDLYCSAECKLTDLHPEIKDLYNNNNNNSSSSSSSSSSSGGPSSPSTTFSLSHSNPDVMLTKLRRAKSLRMQQQQRPSYPWIPLYRRRPALSKRPATSSAGSAAIAHGLLCRAKSTLPQPQFKLQSLLA